MVHSPPYEDWDITLSIGNTLAFEACIRTLLTRGDSIIMEEYAYTSGIYSCRPQGLNIVGIGMDGQGMRADLLDEKLSNWSSSDGPRPRVAYIVPYDPSLLKLTLVLDRIRQGQVCFSNDEKSYTPSSKNTTS